MHLCFDKDSVRAWFQKLRILARRSPRRAASHPDPSIIASPERTVTDQPRHPPGKLPIICCPFPDISLETGQEDFKIELPEFKTFAERFWESHKKRQEGRLDEIILPPSDPSQQLKQVLELKDPEMVFIGLIRIIPLTLADQITYYQRDIFKHSIEYKRILAKHSENLEKSVLKYVHDQIDDLTAIEELIQFCHSLFFKGNFVSVFSCLPGLECIARKHLGRIEMSKDDWYTLNRILSFISNRSTKSVAAMRLFLKRRLECVPDVEYIDKLDSNEQAELRKTSHIFVEKKDLPQPIKDLLER